MRTVYIELHVEITCQVRTTIPPYNRTNALSLYAYVLDFEFDNNFKLLNNAPIRNT